MASLYGEFISDPHGTWFYDLGPTVEYLVEFFGERHRLRRMKEAEVHHDRPAIAGVVLELEADQKIRSWVASATKAPAFHRRLQCLGAVVGFLMRRSGWRPSGRKTTVGLSHWLTKAERYMPPESDPVYAIWRARHPDWEPRKHPKPRRRRRVSREAQSGPTNAQIMRDLIEGKDLRAVRKGLHVSMASIKRWMKQARRDDGEVILKGRGTQPYWNYVEEAENLFGDPKPEPADRKQG